MNKDSLFAIGDIHGCAPELHQLLGKLPLTKNSTIVFLGDYVDRGNFSREVIDTVIQLSKHYNVIPLRGNHENMFLDFLHDPTSASAANFILNGGSSTLANYVREDGTVFVPPEHIEFMKSCQLYYQTEKFFFVHAGLPLKPLNEIDFVEDQATLTWVRQPFLSTEFDFGKKIVHGHSRVPEIIIGKYRIAVDTGCAYGGKLSAIELNSMNVYSVEKKLKNEPRIHLQDKQSKRIALRFDGKVDVKVRKNGKLLHFETLNYNEFGLLISEKATGKDYSLKLNEQITGTIGNEEHSKLKFTAVVVRLEDRPGQFLYGIKIHKVYTI